MNIMSVTNPNFEEPRTSYDSDKTTISSSNNKVDKIEMIAMEQPKFKLIDSESSRKFTEKDKLQLEKRLVLFAIGVLIFAVSIFTHNLTDFDSLMSEIELNSTLSIVNSTSSNSNRNFEYYLS